MKVLIIKTSSLGDLLHTFPAVTEAATVYPDIEFHWAVEEALAEVPLWHPRVSKVIEVPWRRIRKLGASKLFFIELKQFYKKLREEKYDYVIDAQGLLKSALITRFARGLRCGPDFSSAREPLASIFYQRHSKVSRWQHANWRSKKLFASVLNYSANESVDCGIARNFLNKMSSKATENYLVFLHGTVWDSKLWPETSWRGLAKKCLEAGFSIKLVWGNEAERKRAERLSFDERIQVMPRLSLTEVAEFLLSAKGVVSVDTGLAHLTAALCIPAVSIYGATNASLTGAMGENQFQIQSQFSCSPCLSRKCKINESLPPCYLEITPDRIFKALCEMMEKNK